MSDISTKSQELAEQLWAIANDLRGSMDSSKFKNYILLFNKHRIKLINFLLLSINQS